MICHGQEKCAKKRKYIRVIMAVISPVVVANLNRCISQQDITGEAWNVSLEEMCYSLEELHEYNKLYKQKSIEYVWKLLMLGKMLQGT